MVEIATVEKAINIVISWSCGTYLLGIRHKLLVGRAGTHLHLAATDFAKGQD